MPSNVDVLDAGIPTMSSPPDPEDEDSLRYGLALAGVWGSEANPTGYGSFVRSRIPSTSTGIAVTANSVTLDTAGAIVAVAVTAGRTTGGRNIVPVGTPSESDVLVVYDGSGIPTLTFDDATECAVHQMQIDRSLVEHLDADATP